MTDNNDFTSVYFLCSGRKERKTPMPTDQKNLQGQLIAEREALCRSKPSPSKPLGGKKAHGMSTLLGSGGMHQTPKLTRKQISVRSMELYQLEEEGLMLLDFSQRNSR
ncbi:hypothetical protein IGI04_020097 [Brassica rapa subsp. trilocularis]|uniref:Uncharacterized protein n=1 Tax=Brassica rapa subsp. trilocularis TaxID=1813537 RepID=A0ABQ7MHR7_BRACM|nr:hypothetical protein IGI04_020097 [Brassica rapa subsp. trilocularis]